ncbi:SPOR domain-containing protein [Paracoccus sp. N5]|uniref:SPOR domain-containing protein n=1 Tax=Paracoccus sp. N5 TaxID=1101189 RepID=UPI000381486E|nr:SPOR domain-containing protein [Paracoccus sp. N5]
MLWMLRVMLVLAPGLALAQDLRPAETPPADFFARQYIDSKGCVFLRGDDGGWQARVSRDGTPICGYPPTLSARGLDGKPRLRALDPDAGRSRAELLSEALSQTVLTNLRPGELAGDPQPMEKLPDLGPEPSPSGPADALQAVVAAAPALRQEMGGGLKPNLRLCQLLGYDGQPGAAGLGSDPSQGYCGSLPPADLSRLSFARPIGSSAGDTPAAEDKTADAKPAAPGAKPAAEKAAAAERIATVPSNPRTPRAAKPAAGPVAVAGKRAAANPQGPAAKPGKAAAPVVGTIPAGARYVQLGTFADPGNADRAVQRVAGLGYPVLRGKDRVNGREVQFIMAGPFDDREGIVRALNAIRRAGYRDAFPR